MGINMATEEQIRSGETADVYFKRTMENYPPDLNDLVVSEITVSGYTNPWITFTGLHDVLELLKGKPLSIQAVPEGTILPCRDIMNIPVPFMSITGRYRDFAIMETAILGLICQSSGISTQSSLVKLAAGDRPYISFGIRRMHPAISTMIDWAAYVGGADGVSGTLSAERIGIEAVGTMPHALSILLGDERAWEVTLRKKSAGKRTLLIDTFNDEKFAAINASTLHPDIDYIRLDTPSSRRGNFCNLVTEVRWELDLRGFKNVKIMVSGGLNAEDVAELASCGADAFGVGTSVSSAKPVDFAMDIVEVGGIPKTKRGKLSGLKYVYRCEKCFTVNVSHVKGSIRCSCGNSMTLVTVSYMENGKILQKDERASKIRERVLSQFPKISSYTGR